MVETRLACGDNVEGLSICHTPLQYACMNGADANRATAATSPLAAATKRGNMAFISLLFEHGAQPLLPEYCFADPLFIACYAGNAGIVRRAELLE
jgi:ankyrin repeat protein